MIRFVLFFHLENLCGGMDNNCNKAEPKYDINVLRFKYPSTQFIVFNESSAKYAISDVLYRPGQLRPYIEVKTYTKSSTPIRPSPSTSYIAKTIVSFNVESKRLSNTCKIFI